MWAISMTKTFHTYVFLPKTLLNKTITWFPIRFCSTAALTCLFLAVPSKLHCTEHSKWDVSSMECCTTLFSAYSLSNYNGHESASWSNTSSCHKAIGACLLGMTTIRRGRLVYKSRWGNRITIDKLTFICDDSNQSVPFMLCHGFMQ